jgi:hypothetical protein
VTGSKKNWDNNCLTGREKSSSSQLYDRHWESLNSQSSDWLLAKHLLSIPCQSFERKVSDMLTWCCYITVDSAMVPSQNGFCSYKIFIHKKTDLMQIMTKNITFLNNLFFYHREIVKLDLFMTLSLNYANTVL